MKTLAFLLALLAFAWSARPAAAHGSLLRADPPPNSVLTQSPTTIALWFDESLNPQFSSLSLADSTHARVDLVNVNFSSDRRQMTLGVRPNLPPGAYTVSWRALSALDGHITNGAYAIFVGAGSIGQSVPLSATASDSLLQLPLDVAARSLNLLSALALCGALTLGLLLSDSRDNLYALRVATARRLRIWVIASLLALFAGSILAQLLQASAASERSLADVLAQSIWLQTLTSTRFGQAALARIVLVDGLLILFVATHVRAGWRTQALYTTLSVLILLTFSLASHAAASTDPLHVAMIADWLHLVAVGAWTGGLFALAVVGTAGARLAPTDVWFILLRRFAWLAVGAIVLLALTGLYSFWRQVGSPGALATPYGETLVVKLALLVPLLLLAGINALIVRAPWKFEVGRWRLDKSNLQRPISIFRTLRLEAALGALVVLAAATMTALPPARSVAPPALPPYELTRHVGAVNVSLKVDPYAVGSDNFDVRVTDAQGAPLATVSRVTLRFTFLGANLGASSQAMERSAAGAYRLQGSFLSVVGAWMVEAIVQRSDVADDLRVSYRLNVVDPASSRAGDLPDLNSSLVFALLDLMAGAALLVYSQRKHFVEGKFIGAGALALGVALFAMGTIFAPTSAAGVLVNPIPPDAVSLADGKRVYEDSCAVCHGAAGRGNGPLAASLNPRPADFVQHVNLHPDDVLYNWIGEGIPGTAMPPFKDRLSETDRWNVLNYIQATFGVVGTPAPQSNPTVGLDPQALLARSDAALNQLQSVAEVQRLSGDTGLVVTATFHYVAPDKLQFAVSNGNESIAIGDTQYYREPGKPWEKIQRAEPLHWPRFSYAAQATDVQLEGEEIIDGEPCAIVFFRAPNVDYFRHWIGERTGWLRKQQMEAPGHHMLSTFTQFDEPFSISAPTGE